MAGFSLGVMAAQTPRADQARSAWRRPDPLSLFPLGEFAADWPAGVPLQIHGGEADEFFMDEGDVDAARQWVEGRPMTA